MTAVASPPRGLMLGTLGTDNARMSPLWKPRVLARLALATILAAVSGVILGALPSLGSIGSPAEPPGAWANRTLSLAVIAMPPAVAAILPLCLVVHWIMRRRHVEGQRASVIAGSGMAIATLLVVSLFPLLANEFPTHWLDYLPPVLVFTGFALAWPVLCEWLTPTEDRSAPHAELAPSLPNALGRASHTAVETLVAVAALAPPAIIGFFLMFAIGLGAGEDWRPVQVIASPSGSSKAHVVERLWGGAVGGTDTQVYLLASARTWTGQQRGLLVWSGDHVDSVRVVWDSERRLQVQARMSGGASLVEHTQTWSRSGFNVRTQPLP